MTTRRPLVVLDTNVLVGALMSRGRSAGARVLDRWRRGELDLLYTEATLAEADAVIGQRWTERVAGAHDPRALLREVRERGRRVETPAPLPLDLRDAGDRRLVEAAVAGGADFLVTADREVLRLGRHGGVRIVTAGALAALLDGLSVPGEEG